MGGARGWQAEQAEQEKRVEREEKEGANSGWVGDDSFLFPVHPESVQSSRQLIPPVPRPKVPAPARSVPQVQFHFAGWRHRRHSFATSLLSQLTATRLCQRGGAGSSIHYFPIRLSPSADDIFFFPIKLISFGFEFDADRRPSYLRLQSDVSFFDRSVSQLFPIFSLFLSFSLSLFFRLDLSVLSVVDVPPPAAAAAAVVVVVVVEFLWSEGGREGGRGLEWGHLTFAPK